jgi:hypothetical protein
MAYYGTKRKVFISFYQGDRTEVDNFIEKWSDREGVFTAKALGTSDNDDFINSDDPEYVMTQIREKYLGDSSVTIILIGTCTHSRRYVDWEIKSSLRRGSYTPNGLIGIVLPSKGDSAHLPPRFKDNWTTGEANCYARYRSAPTSADQLGEWIEDAYAARTSRAELINNPQEMMKYNAKCKVCGVTH